MATTGSNLQRLLRAAISHHNATTLLHPHHSLRHYHASNIPISNPHLGSTFLSRRVSTRATAHPNLGISDPHVFFRSVHTRATALHKRRRPFSTWPYALTLGCIATGGMIVLYQYREKPRMLGSISDQLEFRFQGSIPHLYRKGHTVVVEGLVRPIRENNNNSSIAAAKNVTAQGSPRNWELYLSATEVLAQPHHVAAALQRNNIILALKQKVSEDKKKIVPTNWCTTPSDEISESAVELSKSESQGMVYQLDSPKLVLTITAVVILALDKFQDLPDLLREGHSVFIKGSTNVIMENRSDEMKEDESNEIKWAKSVRGKTKEIEYHLSAVAVAKHDERYMPREAAAAIGWNVAE